MGSDAPMSAEMITVAASSTSDPLPVKRKSRTASAAPGGVRGEGSVPDRTDVAPPQETAAVVAPRMAEASALKAALPSSTSFARARAGARSSESSLTPPSANPAAPRASPGGSPPGSAPRPR